MATEADELPAVIEARRRSRTRWLWMSAGVAVVVVGIVLFYLFSGRYQSTDDASVRAAQSTISANVAGRVVEVQVHDNQTVRRGDVLFRLDERPFRIAVADATAKLAAARQQIGAARASYRRSLTDTSAARSTLQYQQQEYDRQQRLLQEGIASRAQFERAQHALEQARQQLASTQQETDSELALLSGNPKLPLDQQPSVQQAQAALDHANLQLSYAVVHAPDDGIVTRVEQLQVGDYITAAEPVFTLISSRDIWIEANFKEDQLSYMRPGQTAEVRIDAYSGRKLRAHITSLSPGTGSQFSALPPENATGNWVKVVQRLPVRLQLDATDDLAALLPLRAGLSADVTVDTEHRRTLRTLFGGSAPPAQSDWTERMASTQ